MLYFQGGAAYSSYRHQALAQRLQRLCPEVSGFEAYFDYLVETREPLNQEALLVLSELLEASPTRLPPITAGLFWVTARRGTLSPWTSKATDIAALCGFSSIVRIERLYRYRMHGLCPDAKKIICDPLTQSLIDDPKDLAELFAHPQPAALVHILLLEQGMAALEDADVRLGLSLSLEEKQYLLKAYQTLKRNPTDVELMMFAQVNSEHCRHKIFNAHFTVDHEEKALSLFKMIKNTYAKHPERVIVAYRDNAAVMAGGRASRFLLDPKTRTYAYHEEPAPYVLKVETHNHPTAISPESGAATGSGGEIRDEAATGRGAEVAAGLCGFTVSHLNIEGFAQPWEWSVGKAPHLASALEIMLQGPIGAALFNNEFGRPNLLGYFRTFEMMMEDGTYRGYHKPIMLAGGIGRIRESNIHKKALVPGARIIVLGGPALAIGLGGGSASSRQGAASEAALDFASVQRANPEMQRRAQEVINSCIQLGEQNPILSIHDVGAGGLSNALPELVHADGLGGYFDLRAILSAEPQMSPREIWCNESQERYVLAIQPEFLDSFAVIAQRERCPYSVVGEVTQVPDLIVVDKKFNTTPVHLPMATLFEDGPTLKRQEQRHRVHSQPFSTQSVVLREAIQRVLQFPCVASKSFLITIADRSVGGLVARDSMVGPFQVPVSDCAVTCNSFLGYEGEAMAIGERPPIALLDPAASARMAVGEAITNLAAAAIEDIGDIVMSANWMAAMNHPGEGAGLFDAVKAIAMELCPSLKIAIPVGKDSLSMQTMWQEGSETKSVTSPLSLVITAAAHVWDVRRTQTAELRLDQGQTELLLIDLGQGTHLLGASVLLQTYNRLGECPPDVTDARLLRNFFQAIQILHRRRLLLAYHDRSDGGLLATICEMMFAGHCGVTLSLASLGADVVASLFTEALGAVIQVKSSDLSEVMSVLQSEGLSACTHKIGHVNADDVLRLYFNDTCLYENSRTLLESLWGETSYRLQALRDHASCAQEEFHLREKGALRLTSVVSFDYPKQSAPVIHRGVKPRVAILREQGVNGHVEMAAAFDRVGFSSIDVHMSDLIAGRVRLSDFKGLAACGGFSYGDVLGAGRGWAQSIRLHPRVCEEFQLFFHRPDTFSIGICNGCQMMAYLRDLIPGAAHWPYFDRNYSEQFEARLVMVKVMDSPSIVFRGMVGSVLPVVVSHGEGRAKVAAASDSPWVALRYVDSTHEPTEAYPMNPNGSALGATAFTTEDGRATIMMPHPERVFRSLQLSWHPEAWAENSPWIQLFQNAYEFVR